ncbi:unnamed protein product [Lota lota]
MRRRETRRCFLRGRAARQYFGSTPQTLLVSPVTEEPLLIPRQSNSLPEVSDARLLCSVAADNATRGRAGPLLPCGPRRHIYLGRSGQQR